MVHLLDIVSYKDKVRFEFDDGICLEFKIVGSLEHESLVFLRGKDHANDGVFKKLEINPELLYKKLGIFRARGVCPYCKRSDLNKLFTYLLEEYGQKQSSEISSNEISSNDDPYNWLY